MSNPHANHQGGFIAIDDDPWVSGPYGCALVAAEAGMVTMRAASGVKGNKASLAFDATRARKLAALLNMAADMVEPVVSDPGPQIVGAACPFSTAFASRFGCSAPA